ncbi:Putative mannosyl-3-phosphoglycerate phosphatase [Serratia plymuthica]|uniref:Mannosyl-3-phosphoglycerate phosphatase n=1 Tax=Serratia plymuthica TaxID=82996 RepID=A0A2X4UIE9_SERPL|nr:Putative mannosyl-3-phosphoglycerate phosphatase [Serratia plymuthica]
MLKPSPNLLIFTDLDGSLLDHHSYCWQAAQPWLEQLAHTQTPLIIATSKTAAEVAPLQQQLGLSHWPFIAENGAQIVFPAQRRNHPDYPTKHLGADTPAFAPRCGNCAARPVLPFKGLPMWMTQPSRNGQV